MKIIPKEHHVQIKPYEKTKRGSIEIPKPHRKKINLGEVVAVNPHEKNLSVGDEVYFRKRPLAMMEDETVIIPTEHILMYE